MQGGGKTKEESQLPKIRSQQRIHTANDRRNTEQDNVLMNRPLSNNCRTRSLRAFTTRSVKYESGGNTFYKKIQEVQKQTFIVDRQIKTVEDQIKTLRKTIGNTKKQPGFSRLNESTVSYYSKISSKKTIPLDQENIKVQLKNLEAKILNYRNKIDTHLEKNKAIQQQIDAYRKQISTLKTINSQLQLSFKLTSQKYDQQMEISKKLDAEITEKTQLTHRKKVQNMHQKTQMIKQYDVILKTLDKQLNTEKITNQEGKSQFYLTDIVVPQKEFQKFNKSEQKSARPITSGKKPKLSEIHEKLKIYEKQFEQLKIKVKSENIQEITKQFTQQYQKNFHQYNFINQMYQEYEEINNEQFQLIQKKNDLLKQLQSQKSGSKVHQINDFKAKIKKMNQIKEKIKQDMLIYKKVDLEIKMYLSQYPTLFFQMKNEKDLHGQIHQKSVSAKLHEIFERYSKQFGLNNSQKGRDKRFSKNSITQGKQTVDDLIEQVKKQSQNLKDNRLLTREELQNNTIQLKEKKMQASIFHQKYKTKKQLEKIKILKNKKSLQ